MIANKNFHEDDGLDVLDLKLVPDDNRGEVWSINLFLMFFLLGLVAIAIGAIINLNILTYSF